MTVAKAFIKRDISRNSCTTWQYLYWIKVVSAITFELKTLESLLCNTKVDTLQSCSQLKFSEGVKIIVTGCCTYTLYQWFPKWG